MNPYYEDEGVTLYCGDALAMDLPRADAVVTDPPYGETSLEWDTWPAGWPVRMAEIADQLWCFGSMRMFLERRDEFADWKFAQDIVWEKNTGTSFHVDRFSRVHEHALHFYRGEWGDLYRDVPTFEGDFLKMTRNTKPSHFGIVSGVQSGRPSSTRIVRSVFHARNCRGYAVNETQKPEAVVQPLVEFSVPPGGLVVDPFAGSGTTLLVARRTGRRAIGVEMREEQCEHIVQRLAQREMAL